MGRKKATQLKKETKELFDQHIASVASSTVSTPSSALFVIDTQPDPKRRKTTHATVKENAAAKSGKKKRKRDVDVDDEDEDDAALAAAASSSSSSARAHASSSTPVAPAPAAYFHESDSEDERSIPTRNRRQRVANHPRATKLLNPREAKRLKVASEKAAASKVQRAQLLQPKPVFDVWSEDAPAAVPVASPAAPTAPRQFKRHGNLAKAAEHVLPSLLPKQIDEGQSFHPDTEAHQQLLLKAYEKDREEKEEIEAIQARFRPAPQAELTEEEKARREEEEAREAAATAAEEDESWMDDVENEDDDDADNKRKKKVARKLSITERNKKAAAKERRAKQEALEAERALQRKVVNRLPILLKQMAKEEKIRAKERARIEELKRTNPDHAPKLSKYKEASNFPDFALTEELPQDGSMRKLRPSSHVVADAFDRFRKRHLIETRVKVKSKTSHSVKLVERFKDWEEEQKNKREIKEKEAATNVSKKKKTTVA